MNPDFQKHLKTVCEKFLGTSHHSTSHPSDAATLGDTIDGSPELLREVARKLAADFSGTGRLGWDSASLT